MRKFALALSVLAALGSTAAMAATSTTSTTTTTTAAATTPAKPAMAAPLTVTGAITAIDTKAHTITINKVAYHVSSKFDLSKLKVGENVTVTYKVVKKVDWATKIVVVKA